MPRLGPSLKFGAFPTPAHAAPADPVGMALLAEEVGLDLVTFQDHPYQSAFYDTWTLLSWVAARTTRIHVSGNVMNLPLRQPAVLARSVASLDLLSGGRVGLGLGTGSFWNAVEAMGGPARTPGEAVSALEEALAVIRAIWDVSAAGGVRVDGQFYRVHGAKRGPAPAHPVPIWLGAYGPRMLRLVGRSADGWLPSLGYLKPGDLDRGNAAIDEAARRAGRDPAQITRLLNIGPGLGADEVARLAADHGVDVFILGTDDRDTLARFALETAPRVRQLVGLSD